MLQKAGRNMEHTLIGAYVGLLLGYLIMDNKVNRLHCLFSLMLNCGMFLVWKKLVMVGCGFVTGICLQELRTGMNWLCQNS